jgi:hypothetical protein
MPRVSVHSIQLFVEKYRSLMRRGVGPVRVQSPEAREKSARDQRILKIGRRITMSETATF